MGLSGHRKREKPFRLSCCASMLLLWLFEKGRNMNRDSLLPEIDRHEQMERHINEKARWRNFAGRAQKNPFMKLSCWMRQHGRCAICHRPVSTDNCILHHLDYGRICLTSSCIKVPSPTEKRPNRQITCPDCERCSHENPSEFHECLSRLVIVHKGCHLRLHTS